MLTAKDLTAEEKLRLICGQDGWHTADLGGKIPQITVSDGPVGVRKSEFDENGVWKRDLPAVAYPAIQCLANTWNRSLARKMGESLADDCLDAEVDVLLAPGVNIKRNPLNGRNFEYFSEDPLLAGTLAYEYIDGLQSGGVGACLKHFLANNQEYNRLEQSSEVDDRTLRELYYVPFEIACRAKPVSAMCCYNRVNGVYGSENKCGFDVLRGEFGFDGVIMSDWGAVHDRAASAKAGLDLEMPFDQGRYEKLCEDYRAGRLTDEELDACAQRMLDFIARVKKMSRGKKAATTVERRLDVAQQIAEEGIVLLKNEGALPLKKKQSVTVSGECAAPSQYGRVGGGGSSCVQWIGERYDLAKCLRAKMKGEVRYHRAFWEYALQEYSDKRELYDSILTSDVNVVCVGTGSTIEREGADRMSVRLTPVQEEMILRTAELNPNTVVVIFAGSAVDVSAWKDKVAAIVLAGFCGERGGEAIARVLTGEVNPSGKLSETFLCKIEDAPTYRSYSDPFVARYSEGLDVGYRHYDKHGLDVNFPFGHGLSYSEFKYGDLSLQAKERSVEVSFSIANRSARAGKEVAQVYVRPYNSYAYRPVRELRGFAKVKTEGGEKKDVSVVLDERAFSYYSTSVRGWVCEDGIYGIEVGASSRDIRLQGLVRCKGGKFEIVK